MSQFFLLHPDNPNHRLIRQAAEIVRSGGIIVYPTDSSYALGCHLDDKKAVTRIRQIRHLDEQHHMTLMCRDLSEISKYANSLMTFVLVGALKESMGDKIGILMI